MEPEVRAFLVKIANTISVVLLWMLINLVVGIRYNFAFFEGSPTWVNYVYYLWLLLSLAWLIWYLRRKWKPQDKQG